MFGSPTPTLTVALYILLVSEQPQVGRPASIVVERRIEWSDTDASGHYHNTAAFRLLETAETLLLARLGLLDDVYGRLPRVHVAADFLALLRFHDLVAVSLEVADLGHTSITYAFDIRRGAEVAVRGRAVAVLVDRDARRPQPWEDRHRDLLLSGGPQAAERLHSGQP